MKRREVIKGLAATGIALSTYGVLGCARTERPLNILVMGGTYFVGPAIVNAALERGHQVTLFNRGITNPALFPELRLIKGDRASGPAAYAPLARKKWDVVIDVWPEQAGLVDEATEALAGRTDRYVFISSIAVYNDFQEVGLHEESEVVSLTRPIADWGYAEEKLAAENLVKSRFPDRHIILRPGAIKGWRDPAVDLLYWCLQLKSNRKIIAPGSGLDPLQFIDVKDVGRSAIRLLEQDLSGIYNCTGPMSEPLLWHYFLDAAWYHLDGQSELAWASESFLQTHGVYSFTDLPLWAPLSEDRGFMQISSQKLLDTGFTYTPYTQTLDDCLRWHGQFEEKAILFGTDEVGVGLDRVREEMLLAQLKE